MVAKSSPQKICESIIDSVRSSHLNFSIQETPFSLYLTIRKSYSKRFPTQVLETSPPFLVETSREFESKIETLMTLNSKLSARNKVLEDSQRILTE